MSKGGKFMTEKLISSQTEESDFESSNKTNSSVEKVEEAEKVEETKETKEAEESKETEKVGEVEIDEETEKVEEAELAEEAEKVPKPKNIKESQKPSSNKLPVFLSVLALACSIYNLSLTRNLTGNNFGNSGQISRDSNSANFTEGSIASIANAVSKSVVSIVTSTDQKSFFSNETTSQTAAGTGFILSSDGYVATNKHVVSGANKIGVILDDGTAYEDVELVGTDPLNDFAIIKINNVNNLSPVKLGDSKTTSAGQQVVAIGNALGAYQNSVTSGIISGKGRSLTATDSGRTQYETLSDMIQTDAAINGGNSGGPLVNAAGEVIGINTAYASQGNNVGFAIPISSVKGIIKNVLSGKGFERAVIGVRYINLTPTIVKEKNLSVTRGALIASSKNNKAIISGSAGDKAGLKENDIITAVNGTEIGSSGSLSSLIGEYSVGDTVKITVVRGGKTETLELTLAAYKQ
jgi:peptidase Do